MLNVAERMKSLGREVRTSGAPSSIFGSAASLAQSIETDERFRISVYPIISVDEPEIAMGLASCLAYLLEQYPSTRVYRCFARIDPDDDSAEITAEDYQFQISDWELEGLADNILFSGTLKGDAGGYTLQLALDLSLLSNGDFANFEFQFASLAELVGGLPVAAEALMTELAGETGEAAIISYAPPDLAAEQLSRLLEYVFDWNLDLYLQLWGSEWDEADLLAQFDEIALLASEEQSEFAYWCLGMVGKQIMQTSLEEIGDILAPQLNSTLADSKHFAPAAAALALGLSNLGFVDQATELLQPYLLPDVPASIWISMIEVHMAGGELAEAIDSNQLALENGLQHPALYWQYAQLLMVAEANEWDIDEVLLIDPDEHPEEKHITFEIANALKLQLAQKPNNLSALQLALTYMIDAEDDELWIYFEQLVKQDTAALFVGDIIDRLIDIEHDLAYDILERQLASNPYAYVYMAQLALADDDEQLAADTIATCRQEHPSIDDDLALELQRLELYARLPEFEETFAEVKVMLNAKRHVSEDMVQTLENASEIAPKLVDIYVILSRCYLSWKDSETALEVLQDGAELAGPHPQIDLGLAQVLWLRGQQEDAITKLNQSLEAFPNDVLLLVQMANYLIINDQFDAARQYIAQAELIAPSHRAIWQVRRLVAQKMAE